MTPQPPKLILASRSPRRRELLKEAGYDFTVRPAEHVEECFICSRESPAEYVGRLAYEKAAEVAGSIDHGIVIGCDTVAECGGEVLGKPHDEGQARRMLELLSGREHRVLSGLCVWPRPNGPPLVRVALTTLRMDTLSGAQLEEYLATGQWEGKAGAFGYQDRLGWVHILEGSESNVVGLPLELLTEMLRLTSAHA